MQPTSIRLAYICLSIFPSKNKYKYHHNHFYTKNCACMEGDGWGIVSHIDASIVKEVETEMEILHPNDCI